MTVATIFDKAEQDSPGVNLMPPMVFYTCLLLGGVLEFFIPSNIPLFTKPLRIGLGVLVGGSGFAFMMVAHETFKRISTNIPTNLPATAFVIGGAYGISRNPMYVGGSAFFLGVGLMLGSIWILAAYIPLGLYLSRYVIPREEVYLERTFGDDYKAYCRKVRRWL
ncbi:MAG: isoprenylcysteine carboxylmethyltransferase family protein [Desulfobacteraceae bacterium]|jgi:protein-S-isoprenylcysteine O-methyltransferase Ste14